MKRFLLAVLVSLGLNQIQAQILPCDSISVTGSQSQLAFVLNSANAPVNWQTTTSDSIILQQDSMSTYHNVLNYDPITGMSYDTLITSITWGNPLSVCYVTWIWNGTSWARMGMMTPSVCDSVEYAITPQNFNNVLQLEGWVNGICPVNFPCVVDDWNWSVCANGLCYADTGETVYFQQFTTDDTLKVCLDVYGTINGTTFGCQAFCDSLVYGTNGWTILNMGNPTGINELEINAIGNKKIYDLMGRELNEIPVGVMYIRNNKLYIKTK